MANDAISEHFATYAKARAKTPCTAQNRMGMEKSGNKHFLKRTNKKKYQPEVGIF
ncbi:TPA: hypothetical protein ACFRHS_001670 [Neisseria lactamica]|uniref:hypothetical protein n=1 Tax=Neisseria lactamica TaxID=486 RepID=UPI001864939B|nr:hypothetical protein [Neisseria lactamica]